MSRGDIEKFVKSGDVEVFNGSTVSRNTHCSLTCFETTIGMIGGASCHGRKKKASRPRLA